MLQSNRIDTLIHATLKMPVSEGSSLKKLPESRWYTWAPRGDATLDTRSIMTVFVDNSDLYEFRQKVADLGEDVVAVLAELGEGGERHVTTFLAKRNPDLEQGIYDIEAQLIQKYQDRVFDFHLRPVPLNSAGNPELPSGPYFLLTWHAASYGTC